MEDIDEASDIWDRDHYDPPEPLYFSTVRLVEGDGAPRLVFDRPRRAQPMTEQAATLYQQIESTAQSLRELAEPEPLRDGFRKLKGIAILGLIGAAPDPASAREELQRLRREELLPILEQHRAKYARVSMWVLGLWLAAALTGIGLAVIYGPSFNLAEWSGAGELAALTGIDPARLLPLVVAYLFGVVGLAVGDMLTVFSADSGADLERYRSAERFRLSPGRRMVYALVTWFVVLIFLGLDWIILGLGGVSLNSVTDSAPWLGVVAGLVVALAFDHVSELIRSRATAVLRAGKN